MSFISHVLYAVFVRVKYIVQFVYFSLLPVRSALNHTKRDFSITVSLTSFQARLSTLHLCIKSLMVQSLKPDRIVLYLGTDCDGVTLPAALLALEKRGLTIKRGYPNLRPHKKYMFAMKEYPQDYIVTVDDDLLYSRGMIADLWRTHLQYPEALPARRVHLMKAAEGRLLAYNDWERECGSVRTPSFALFSTNGAGSMFAPHCLPPQFLDPASAAELCLNADDVWIKFALIKAGIPVVWTGRHRGMPDEIRIKAERKQALMDSNVTDNANDTYIAGLEKHFGISLADYC